MEKNQLTWKDLFAYGNLVSVTISMFYFKVSKTLSDFGFNEDKQTSKKSGTHGHWYLIPEENRNELTNVAYRIRNLVKDYSVEFPLVENGRFMPDSSVETFLAELELLKAEFFKKVDKTIEQLPALQQRQFTSVRQEVEKIGRDSHDPNLTVDRIKASVPSADDLRERFGVKHNLFAFQAPINEDVAEKLESEGESVKTAISDLIENAKKPLIEKVEKLLELVKKGSTRSFNMKSINAGLRDCDRFERQNVFNDPFISKSIQRLRGLLNSYSADLEADDLEEFQLGLSDLKSDLTEKKTDSIQKAVITKIGKRKLL